MQGIASRRKKLRRHTRICAVNMEGVGLSDETSRIDRAGLHHANHHYHSYPMVATVATMCTVL
jgi:hypothetical protein